MNDTIIALATPPGVSGLSVIRVSGPDSIKLTDLCFNGKMQIIDTQSHTIHYGKLSDGDRLIDTVTVSVFRTPNSYTGEDVIEIGCHGGVIVYREIISLFIRNGARLAEPGEFTRRAFINGRMDLMQVEAVADIIHSVSVTGSQTAARQLRGDFTVRLQSLRKELLDVAGLLELELDFAEEDIQFTNKSHIADKINETKKLCDDLTDSYSSAEILRSGYYVGIAGYPNSGKSTLFNSLLKRKRAIISEIPGTTRDYLEEILYINGIAVKLVDTAGIRDTSDIIEIEGIKLVDSILSESNLVLVINDISISPDNSNALIDQIKNKYPDCEALLLQNKIDKTGIIHPDTNDTIYLSAKMNIGIEKLKNMIYESAEKNIHAVSDVLINQRHYMLLKNASSALQNALHAVNEEYENELIAIDIRRAVKIIGELTGESFNEEILNHIFSHFCIGK